MKAAIAEALSQVTRVLKSPAPDALLHSFDGSAITYRVRFWVADYEFDDEARDQVRTALFYAFGRHGIEIPWPIEVGYEREWPEPDEATKLRVREQALAGIDLFARLGEEHRRGIAKATRMLVFGDGESIVRQDQAGHSMFIVTSGRVEVVLEPQNTRVAIIESGGYFGEMSLLTGEPRTATVRALGDVRVLELAADVFRTLGAHDPQAIEQVGIAAMERRPELDQARDAVRRTDVIDAPTSFLTRMKRFLGVG